ncbi:MAG: nucleotidyltransferase family protein [candidate division Zixibacteria bacterium]|nr:nucleotidyltransferase family protein [candidate division Zixibacteria bacterium]
MKKNLCDEIAGVILAAGEGKRIGHTKGLVKADGVTFLERVVECLKAADCKPILVVGGADYDDIKLEALRLGVGIAHNTRWKDGQFSSLKVGLTHLKMNVCGAVISLVDHPFVKAESYQDLINAFRRFPQRIVMPVYRHQRGHPVVIPRAIIREIIEAGDDLTLKDIIGNHENMTIMHRCDDPGVLQDIDTMDDLMKARKK